MERKPWRILVVPIVVSLPALTMALVLWLLGSNLPAAHAASFTVTKFTDSNDGTCDADCSLREAIIAANGNGQPDTITLGAGKYVLSLAGINEDASATGDLDISKPLTITGAGLGQTIIDASSVISDRVLEIRPGAGTVVISGVTIMGGNCTGCWGSGIYNYDANLALVNTTIVSNATNLYGGGVAISFGSVILSNGQILSNTAGRRGGGVFVAYAAAAFTQTGNSLIAYNVINDTGVDGHGGGMYISQGRAILEGGQIAGNAAVRYGGGVYIGDAGSITSSGIRIANNQALAGGGVYIATSSATLGGGQISGNAANNGGGIDVYQGSAMLSDVQIVSNTANVYGGGVGVEYQGRVILGGGQVVSNTAGRRGGGVYVSSANAILTQTGKSLIAYNLISDTGTDGYGGGVYVSQGRTVFEGGHIIRNVAAKNGGGVYVGGAGSAVLNAVQVAGNQAGYGGGVYNNDGVLTLVNATVSSNKAITSDGGLYNNTGMSVLTFTTVASNTAPNGSGVHIALGTLLLQDTLVAHNTPVNCSSAITSNGHNLDDGNTCGLSAAGDMTNTNPLLDLLDGDGTHPLLSGSPAIDTGLCLAGITTDQRGVPRPQDGDRNGVAGCDIGAYEKAWYQIYLPVVMRN